MMKNMAERLTERAEHLRGTHTVVLPDPRGMSTHRLLQLHRLLDRCEHCCLRKAGAAVGAESIGNRVAAIYFLEQAARYRRVARRVRKRLERELGS